MSPRTANLTLTGKGLRIGIAHTPPPTPIYGDALRLQAALLEPKTAQPLPLFARIAAAVWSRL